MSGRDGWGRQMRGGVLWSNASFIATRAVSMISLLILARLLTPSEFGVVAAVTVYVSLIELTSDLGMKATVVYEQDTGITRRVQNAYTVNLLFAGGLAALGVLFAPLVADFFQVSGDVELFRLMALNPLLRGLGNIQDGILQRDMQFKRRAIPEFAAAAGRAAVSIPLAASGVGAASLVVGYLAGTVVWTTVQWILVPLRPTFAFDRKIVRSMVSYGGDATALALVSAVVLRVDQLTIGRVLGERALGLYSVAFRLPELLIESVTWNISRVAFPGLARKRVADEQGLPAATRRILYYQALYTLPLAAGMCVLGPSIIVTLFGDQWTAAGGVASAIAVSSALSAIGFPLGDVFKALGRQRVLVILHLLQLPVYVGVIVAVADAGIVAVGWARAGAELFYGTLVALFASRIMGTPVLRVLSGALPGMAGALGVVLGAGAVRLAWDGPPAGVLVAGTVAGLIGAIVTLRVLAPAAFAELRQQLRVVRGVLRRRRAEVT
jgi:O-antigen/teichoic acid export membrane protein